MMLSKQQLSQVKKAISLVQNILAAAESESKQASEKPKQKGKRYRRSAEDAAQLKKEVQAARKKGVPVSLLAKKYGVSTAYIYMIE